MYRYFLCLILCWLGTYQVQGQIEVSATEKAAFRLVELRQELEKRLLNRGEYQEAIPNICYKVDLPSNARFEEDTIWIGQIQQDFQTTDDTLSILYHEYFHFLVEGKYTYSRDSAGQIVQWKTGDTYSYIPDEKEVMRELHYFETYTLPAYGSMTDEQKTAHLNKLKYDLEKPRELLFIYAPSNLAKEEIEAYEFQLSGDTNGIYQLSSLARASIERKLKQTHATLIRRLDYEKNMRLNPDGTKK